ncbi:MAG: hypothetical protein M3071_22970 [Actinomycetota bacterium]|nr:hypothetical protein [Actinomycetota bacterium]
MTDVSGGARRVELIGRNGLGLAFAGERGKRRHHTFRKQLGVIAALEHSAHRGIELGREPPDLARQSARSPRSRAQRVMAGCLGAAGAMEADAGADP